MSSNTYDCLIIGGGAAGLCCAIGVKTKCPDISVAVAEQLPRVCKKLITTGNGRCNITNKDLDISHYHTHNKEFCADILKRYGNREIEDFFNSIGIDFYFEEDGRVYPASLQASSVVDALRFKADEIGVITLTDTPVFQVKSEKEWYTVSTNNNEYRAKSVLFATGLYSGGKMSGSDGSGLKILQKMGYKSYKTAPALVQIKTETEIVRQLKGIKVNAAVTLCTDNIKLRKEYGEVLFCDYGLSGPPVMQISGEVATAPDDKYILLDLSPLNDYDSLLEILKRRKATLDLRHCDEFLSGLLNKRVGQTVMKICGFKQSDYVKDLKDGDLREIAATVKKLRFKVTGTTGFDNSQVTSGGIDTEQFYEKTMMSKLHKGLFCAGEILDVYGDCGGYNLAFAWASGMCAADGITDFLGDGK